MEVMFTTHPEGGPGKYYMVVAEAEEWRELVDFLFENAPTALTADTAAWKLVEGLESWGGAK